MSTEIELLTEIARDLGQVQAELAAVRTHLEEAKAENRGLADSLREEYRGEIAKLWEEIRGLRTELQARALSDAKQLGASEKEEKLRLESFGAVLMGWARKGGEVIIVALLAAGLALVVKGKESTGPSPGAIAELKELREEIRQLRSERLPAPAPVIENPGPNP